MLYLAVVIVILLWIENKEKSTNTLNLFDDKMKSRKQVHGLANEMLIKHGGIL